MYYLQPTAVRLQYDVDGAPHDQITCLTMGLDAQWNNAYTFIDPGFSAGLTVAFGALTGQLTAVDLQLGTAYDHTILSPAAGLITPQEFTPSAGGTLTTIAIGIFFDASGAGGTEAVNFLCLTRPEQLSPAELVDGLVATNVAWRWEIREDV